MTPTASRPPFRLIAAVAAAIIVIDQVTKSLALVHLADGPIDLVGSLRLNLSFNPGAAFSLGRGMTPVLTALGVVLLGGLLLFTRTVQGRPAGLAIGLVIGGAAGNLIDRLVRGHDGAVVDFIDVGWWPIFNIADSAIVVGALFLVATALFERDPGPEEEQPSGEPTAASVALPPRADDGRADPSAP